MSPGQARRWLETKAGRGTGAALVAASAASTLLDLAEPSRPWVHVVGIALTGAAVAEGLVRAWGEPRGWRRGALRSFPELVLVPTLAAAPGSPLLLLRFARLLRLFALAEPSSRRLRPSTRALVRVGLVATLALFVGSVAIYVFERHENPSLATPSLSFTAALFSMVAGEPIPMPPVTWGGRAAIGLVIGAGLAVFATVAGTVGAVVTDAIRTGGPMVDWEDLEGHLIICGWNRKAEVLVREVHSAMSETGVIVVITDADGEPSFQDPGLRRHVQFLQADFTEVASLERAGVRRATKCILLSDTSRGRSERDADARTVLAALTIERLNPEVYTCAEVHTRDHVAHLRMGNVNDVVVSGEHSAFLLAQAALTKGVMGLFEELLTLEYGNKFTTVDVPPHWVGKTFDALLVALKREHEALLVGVRSADGRVSLNPKDHTFAKGEALVLLASRDVVLDRG